MLTGRMPARDINRSEQAQLASWFHQGRIVLFILPGETPGAVQLVFADLSIVVVPDDTGLELRWYSAGDLLTDKWWFGFFWVKEAGRDPLYTDAFPFQKNVHLHGRRSRTVRRAAPVLLVPMLEQQQAPPKNN